MLVCKLDLLMLHTIQLKKESRAYSWPKKEIIIKEAKLSKVLSKRLGRKPEDIVKLDANENPYGPPPEERHTLHKVFEALGSMKFPHIYPDLEYRRLQAALAEDSGIVAEYILVGCGADELVDLIMQFTELPYSISSHMAVPRISDHSLNVEKIGEVLEQEKPKLVAATDLMHFLEFRDFVRLFDTCLAELLVGYEAFSLSIIEYLWTAKQPYNVSAAAEISACAALKNPVYLENVKVDLLQERERLFKLLKEVPFLNPYPSYSNFFLCEVTSGMDAKKLKEDLAEMGVMIRHYNNKELSGYVRVSRAHGCLNGGSQTPILIPFQSCERII
ncbi:Histidinol-phosphate aminotransferase 2 [Forsythia ovata]|uniref:histidinol-phosphate transaminase n=1 Tax=Forsythia ovata TaxID=205694 RepID=A0ABD1WBT5_9LAMI